MTTDTITKQSIISGAPSDYPLEQVFWVKENIAFVSYYAGYITPKKKFSLFVPKGSVGISILTKAGDQKLRTLTIKSDSGGQPKDVNDGTIIYGIDEIFTNTISQTDNIFELYIASETSGFPPIPKKSQKSYYLSIDLSDDMYSDLISSGNKIEIRYTFRPELETTWFIETAADQSTNTDTYPEPDPIISPLEVSGCLISHALTDTSTTLLYTVPEKKKATVNIDACLRGTASADLTFYVGESAQAETMIKQTHSLPHESVDEFSRKTQKRSMNIGSILMVAGDKLWVKIAKGTTTTGTTSGSDETSSTYTAGSTTQYIPAPTIGADGKVVNAPQDGIKIFTNFLSSAGSSTSTTPSAQNYTFINPFQSLLDSQQNVTPPTTITTTTVAVPAEAQPAITPPTRTGDL